MLEFAGTPSVVAIADTGLEGCIGCSTYGSPVRAARHLRETHKSAIHLVNLAHNTKRKNNKMTGNLLDQLAAKAQRETAGADSASRFDYQKDWAFCRMLRHHLEGDDYLVAFEFHDDVVFLTPSTTPQLAEFCQVKTSSSASPRKLSSLTARPKGKDSILAKMMSNFDGICAAHDVHVILVSNNTFDFSASDICAKDIDDKLKTKLVAKLQDELKGFDPKKLDKLHFKVTGVSLDAMRSYLNGEAMDLFCEKFGEDHGLNVRTWIRLIQGEIARKNNYPSDKISDVNELIERKCINRPFVEDTLSTMHDRSRKPFDVSMVSGLLLSTGWSHADVIRLQKKIPQASNDFYSASSREVEDLVAQIAKLIVDGAGQPKDISTFLSDVASNFSDSSGGVNPYLQPDYLKALGVLVYYDQV